MSDEKKEALDALHDLFEQCQEDCPQEYRSRHLVDALEEAEELLVREGLRVKIEEALT